MNITGAVLVVLYSITLKSVTMSITKLPTLAQRVDIGISDNHREGVAEALVRLLADIHVLYVKTRNYHWNVQGMQFQPLHELFGAQYDKLALFGDDIAERIRSLGFFAPGSMAAFLQSARLSESGHLEGDARKMLENLLHDQETIIQILRHDVEEAMDTFKDAGTSDFLTGLMEEFEKMAWMIRVHLG